MPDLFDFGDAGGILAIVALFVVLVLIASYIASRYRVANANEALIVAGSRGAKVRDERGDIAAPKADDKGIRVVVGGGTFVLPLVHKVGRLKLTARQIGVALPDAVTSQGIKVAVQGVATFKIGRDVESIRNAAERFLDAQDQQVDSIVKNVLEGSLRSIVGTLTIEELIMDRQKLLQQVQDSAKGDLATSGLQIDAFTIQSINDESGYVDLLGQQKLAVVERDARVAKAAADQEAAVREAEANQVKINAERDVALRRADVEMQTAAAEARAAQSGPLAQAEATQEVVRKQTELAELEAARKQQELVATTVRPAEAEAEAQVRRADGERQARIAAAQADAERVRLEGNAEATAVLAKGEAEAKALALRADAYKQFNEAAVIQTVLSMLPEIVRAAAEPMSKIDSLTVLSNDGASDVVRTTTRTVAEGAATVKGLTGIDIPDLVGRAMVRGGIAEAGAAPAARAAPPTTRGRRSPERDAPTEGAPSDTVTSRASDAAEGQAPTAEPPALDPDAAMAAARESLDRAAAVASPAATPARPPDATALTAPPRPITRETTLTDAARILAVDLAGIQGIERYFGTRLSALDSGGPRALRALWASAKRVGAERYGDWTIGQLIDAARRGG